MSVSTETNSQVGGFTYEGKDLDSMSKANNYHNWILDHFSKYVTPGTILEVGAGMGSFTEAILNRYPDNKLISLEPSNEMYPRLEKLVSGKQSQGLSVDAQKVFTFEAVKKLKKEGITNIIYNNVLEHIEDDLGELKTAYDILDVGGHVLSFSPALPQLYGAFDKSVDHVRRYYLKDMKQKFTEAGFDITEAYYFDFVGMILWWGKFKLLKSDDISSGNVELFDKFFVPVLSALEPSKLLPCGKNVLVIGRKS